MTINGTNDAQNYPAQTGYVTFQLLQDKIQGVGAVLSGQPFQVYRCTADGDFIQDDNRIYASYAMQYEQLRGKELRGLITDQRQGMFWYKLLTDFTPIKLGDVFILNDPYYGRGANLVDFDTDQFIGVAFAGHGVLKSPIGARLDRTASIYRAADAPDAEGYWKTTFDAARPLVCEAGVWALGDNGDTVSTVPVGFMPDNKGKGDIYNKNGDEPRATSMKIYVPPLRGFLFKENDWLVMPAGDRYRVVNPYYQDTNIVGSQLICQREDIQT